MTPMHELIESARNAGATHRAQAAKADLLADALAVADAPDESWGLSVLDGQLILTIPAVGDLPAARRWLRGLCGKWADKIGQRWSSMGQVITSWAPTSNPPFGVTIWYCCYPADYPAELRGPHCDWQKVESTDYVFACSVPQQGAAE